MAEELRFYFHPRSPYARIALDMVVREKIADLIPIRPVLFTKVAGTDELPNPAGTPAKMMYLMQDVPRATMRQGLPIQSPSVMEPDFIPYYRAYFAARDQGKAVEFTSAVANARWGDGADIGQQEIIDQCAKDVGLDPATLEFSGLKDAIGGDVEWIEKDGAFGVPFAVFDNGGKRPEKFFGQDRFDILFERVREAAGK